MANGHPVVDILDLKYKKEVENLKTYQQKIIFWFQDLNTYKQIKKQFKKNTFDIPTKQKIIECIKDFIALDSWEILDYWKKKWTKFLKKFDK